MYEERAVSHQEVLAAIDFFWAICHAENPAKIGKETPVSSPCCLYGFSLGLIWIAQLIPWVEGCLLYVLCLGLCLVYGSLVWGFHF